MIKKNVFLFFILLQVLFLYAKNDKKNTENLPLLNTKWVLTEISETPILQTLDTAFITFYDSYKFSGNFGCNLFFGEFTFGKRRIKMDFIGATKKFCANMQLEEQFLKIMRNDITHYYIEKNTLYLFDKKRVVCKFEGQILKF